MNTTLILTIIPIVMSIALGISQLFLYKKQAKKADIDSFTELVNTTTNKTKTEFDIMNDLVMQLRARISDLQEEITDLKSQNTNLLNEIAELKTQNTNKDLQIQEVTNRLTICETKLNQGITNA